MSSRRAFNSDAPKAYLKSRMALLSKEDAKSSSSNVEKFKRGKEWAMIACFAGLVAVAIPLYPATKDIIEDASAKSVKVKIARKIKDSIAWTGVFDATKRNGTFVNRPILSSKIEAITRRKEVDGKYFIVYGAQGIGKSAIIDSVVQGRRGVLKIPVTSNTSKEEITREIARKTGTTSLNPNNSDFVNAMLIGLGDDGTAPTIIFGIEHKEGLDNVRSTAKEFAETCNVILVVSEPNAVLEFGNDPDREEFIYVDEFTELEAGQHLMALGLELSEADVKYLIDNVGGNPAAMKDLYHSMTVEGMSVQDFVAYKLMRATADLVAFPHKALLKALKEHPEGVSPLYFNNMESKGVDLSDPSAVAVAMIDSNVLTYRIELGKYVMLSRLHEVALRTYEPIVPLSPADIVLSCLSLLCTGLSLYAAC